MSPSLHLGVGVGGGECTRDSVLRWEQRGALYTTSCLSHGLIVNSSLEAFHTRFFQNRELCGKQEWVGSPELQICEEIEERAAPLLSSGFSLKEEPGFWVRTLGSFNTTNFKMNFVVLVPATYFRMDYRASVSFIWSHFFFEVFRNHNKQSLLPFKSHLKQLRLIKFQIC